jgi:hypothetical protein
MTALFDLKDQGVTVAEIHRNLPPSAFYEHAIRYERTLVSPRMVRWLPIPESKPAARLRTSGL